ncbi:hypothetical protein FGU65_08115 [Methanoculleus sp. FWC-SCC1]|uniref:Uncharacterized protein n=1 Tax=Methanoculleus frigidifontis TaxID=2584085 RepID=A0ABT8MA80_9EURY|nr:hypothetical protein [Methanoculleus sp. FWC-SCC1]MDN7024851.1 hypothetical protein [Methanoculleus sp. FWC-SCC1]
MAARLILPGVLALCVAVAALAAGCTGPQVPPTGHAAPTEQPVQVPTGEAGPFSEKAFAGEDRVIVRYAPQSDEPTTYHVSYEVPRNSITSQRAKGRLYENIAKTNPITVAIARDPGETVAIDATIRYANGTVVWESSAACGSVVIQER